MKIVRHLLHTNKINIFRRLGIQGETQFLFHPALGNQNAHLAQSMDTAVGPARSMESLSQAGLIGYGSGLFQSLPEHFWHEAVAENQQSYNHHRK